MCVGSWMEDGGWSECLRGVIRHASASGWWEIIGQTRRPMWRNEMDLNDRKGADY